MSLPICNVVSEIVQEVGSETHTRYFHLQIHANLIRQQALPYR